MKRVLVLDGEQRSSLAVVRALGEKGIPVIVGSGLNSSLAGASKYCIAQEKYRNPLTNLSYFFEDIQRIIHLQAINIIVPCTDITSSAVLNGGSVLHPQVLIMAPSPEQYFAASDKIELINRACKLAVPCPYSKVICGIEEWKNLSAEQNFPVIFKPRASVLIKGGTLLSTAVKIVHDYKEGAYLIHNDSGFSVPFLVQQKIEGEGIGIFALYDRGQPIAFFSHRRLREKPLWGGVSVLCESVVPNPQTIAYSMRLLTDIEFHGVAMVEFKRDLKTGIPFLMEINARFWGSLQLAVDAGVNFPYLFYKLTIGDQICSVANSNYLRLRWLLGDFDSLLSGLVKRHPASKMLQQKRTQLLFEFFISFFRKTKYQVWRKDDPIPFLVELREYLRRFFF
mgnify:FL=1